MDSRPMEFKYRIYPDQRFIAFRCSGSASLEFAQQSYEELASDPDFDPSFDGVGDWRRIAQSFTSEEAAALGMFVATRQLSNGKWAGLVAGPVITALAHLYRQEVASQHSLELFSTVAGASRFLRRDIAPLLV